MDRQLRGAAHLHQPVTVALHFFILCQVSLHIGERIYSRYGFVDAFNPNTQWVGPDVIGIDVGITLLSAENLRSENVWRWFMRNPEINRSLRLVGLQ